MNVLAKRLQLNAALAILLASIALCLHGCVGGAAADETTTDWDTDGDGISDSVEVNPPNVRLYGFNPSIPNANPSVAHGTPACPDSISPFCGYLEHGIKLTGREQGLYHYVGDWWQANQDDWGTLRLLNRIEATARDWSGPRRECTFSIASTFGFGDLSWGEETTQLFGGRLSPHGSHQNGLDVDIRFVRTDGTEQPVGAAWDPFATGDLINCFLYYTDVEKIYVNLTLNGGWYYPPPNSVVVNDLKHNDHFHVRVRDPDGLAN